MDLNRRIIEFAVKNWENAQLLTDMFKLNDLLVFEAKYDFCQQGFVYRCHAPWLEEQPEGSAPVPFELRHEYVTDADGETRLHHIVLVRSPVPEPPPPQCRKCERLKKALEAKNWVTVLDRLSEAHA